MPKPKEKYLKQFTNPSIRHEDLPERGKITYIETQRFTAKSLYSDKTRFEEFEQPIQDLYTNVFANSQVMEKFATGKTKTQEEFAKDVVNKDSAWWVDSYPFSGFIITDNESDEIVGYEAIKSGDRNNEANLAYIISKTYQRGGNKELTGVGYECVGGIVLNYAQELYDNKTKINVDEKLEDDCGFTNLVATARIDNPASYRILQNLGLQIHGAPEEKYGALRYNFVKDFKQPEEEITYDLDNQLIALIPDYGSHI